MNRAALKRVEAWLLEFPGSCEMHGFTADDLRAVLALAKSAEELRRRVRGVDKAVRLLERAGEDGYILEVEDVLAALRKPVARGRR